MIIIVINNIDRQYAIQNTSGDRLFYPSTLGLALVNAYNNMVIVIVIVMVMSMVMVIFTIVNT